MHVVNLSQPDGAAPDWVLAYATVDQDIAQVLDSLRRTWPNTRVFGATSFQGVFTPAGFERGLFGLAATPQDGVRAEARLVACGADEAREQAAQAARAAQAALGAPPSAVMLHATPGFEERILEGLKEVGWGTELPIYGGSAADDDLSGRWQLFSDDALVGEGFLLVAFHSTAQMLGAFVSGYFGTKRSGKVTRAEGRTVYTIDDRPAAEVLNEWNGGTLAPYLETGGVVLAETTLSPLGRIVDRTHGLPRYLLSHPHQVIAGSKAVSFFTEFNTGDEVEMMMGTEGSLLERSQQVVARARGRTDLKKPRGGILVYCGGCVGAIQNRVDEVAQVFGEAIHRAPFVGVATFGEVGTFEWSGEHTTRHGNLMCDTLLFR